MRSTDLLCTVPCPGCGAYETKAVEDFSGAVDAKHPLSFYCVKSCGWRLPLPEKRTIIEKQYWTRAYVESCQMRGIKPDSDILRTGVGLSTMAPVTPKPVAPVTFPVALAGKHRTQTKDRGQAQR